MNEENPIVEPCINISYSAECPYCEYAEIFEKWEFDDNGEHIEKCQECGQEFIIKIPKDKILTTVKMLEEMGTIQDPWGLFEPCLKKDKICTGLWRCSMMSNGIPIAYADRKTIDDAVKECFDSFKSRKR